MYHPSLLHSWWLFTNVSRDCGVLVLGEPVRTGGSPCVHFTHETTWIPLLALRKVEASFGAFSLKFAFLFSGFKTLCCPLTRVLSFSSYSFCFPLWHWSIQLVLGKVFLWPPVFKIMHPLWEEFDHIMLIYLHTSQTHLGESDTTEWLTSSVTLCLDMSVSGYWARTLRNIQIKSESNKM